MSLNVHERYIDQEENEGLNDNNFSTKNFSVIEYWSTLLSLDGCNFIKYLLKFLATLPVMTEWRVVSLIIETDISNVRGVALSMW